MIENGARDGNTRPLRRREGKERSEKNGENAMKAEATSTLLPWLIGQKHKPKFKNSSLNPKHVPESKNTSLNPKHIPEFKNISQNPKKSPRIQKCFGFWEVFWILGCVFGFWDLFCILGRVFEFWKCFVPTSHRTLHL